MDETPAFEYGALENDMKSLAAEVARNRENAELQNSNERELVKEAIRAFPRLNSAERPGTGVPVPTPQPVPATASAQAPSNSPLPDYAQSAPAEVKLEIEYLIDVAFQHGLSKALAESEKSPYFVQDAFHDSLAGKLYPELQKRGIVK
jgi:hypothetical protein